MPTFNSLAPAVLIWLPDGQTPTADSFGPEAAALEDVVDQATAEQDGHPSEQPWIKSEGKILGPSVIGQLRTGLRATRMFDAPRS